MRSVSTMRAAHISAPARFGYSKPREMCVERLAVVCCGRIALSGKPVPTFPRDASAALSRAGERCRVNGGGGAGQEVAVGKAPTFRVAGSERHALGAAHCGDDRSEEHTSE